MPGDEFEPERRRLAAMLPGAAIEPVETPRPVVEMVAVVDDLDRPIPVLVERGGYAYPADVNAALDGRRWLRWPATGDVVYELHLVRRSA